MSLIKKATRRSKPAYQRIKDSILKNIHTGKWQAGDVIPTENALAKKFCVSRMTVNRALKELSEDKVLERRQGSGTFVAQQKYNNTIVEVRNIAADIKAKKKHYEAKVLTHRRLLHHELSPSLLDKFNNPFIENHKIKRTYKSAKKKDQLKNIIEVNIVHYADGSPIQFEERWVDEGIVPDFIHQDFTVINCSDYLISKAPLESGNYSIRAVAAPVKIAKALHIEVGDCALLVSRQTYSEGKVVTFVKMWHAGCRYEFSGTI